MKCNDQERDHHQCPQLPSRRQRHVGDVLRNQHAERVDAGAGPADAVRHPDHAHRDDCIHAHREAHRHDDGHKWYILLAHPDRKGADAEQQQTAGNQQPG